MVLQAVRGSPAKWLPVIDVQAALRCLSWLSIHYNDMRSLVLPVFAQAGEFPAQLNPLLVDPVAGKPPPTDCDPIIKPPNGIKKKYPTPIR